MPFINCRECGTPCIVSQEQALRAAYIVCDACYDGRLKSYLEQHRGEVEFGGTALMHHDLIINPAADHLKRFYLTGNVLADEWNVSVYIGLQP